MFCNVVGELVSTSLFDAICCCVVGNHENSRVFGVLQSSARVFYRVPFRRLSLKHLYVNFLTLYEMQPVPFTGPPTKKYRVAYEIEALNIALYVDFFYVDCIS